MLEDTAALLLTSNNSVYNSALITELESIGKCVYFLQDQKGWRKIIQEWISTGN